VDDAGQHQFAIGCGSGGGHGASPGMDVVAS
jgi:hypothetical protein